MKIELIYNFLYREEEYYNIFADNKMVWDLRWKKLNDDIFLLNIINIDIKRKWIWREIINILKKEYKEIYLLAMKDVIWFWIKMWAIRSDNIYPYTYIIKTI